MLSLLMYVLVDFCNFYVSPVHKRHHFTLWQSCGIFPFNKHLGGMPNFLCTNIWVLKKGEYSVLREGNSIITYQSISSSSSLSSPPSSPPPPPSSSSSSPSSSSSSMHRHHHQCTVIIINQHHQFIIITIMLVIIALSSLSS